MQKVAQKHLSTLTSFGEGIEGVSTSIKVLFLETSLLCYNPSHPPGYLSTIVWGYHFQIDKL